MKSRSKKIMILMVVIISATGIYYLYERHQAKKQAEREWVARDMQETFYKARLQRRQDEIRWKKEKEERAARKVRGESVIEPVVLYYDNGQKKEAYTLVDGKEEGAFTRWYENGQKKYETFYRDGVSQGQMSAFYKSGKKKEECTPTEKPAESICITWYEEGQKKYEYFYLNGWTHGVSRSWYQNGVMEKEIQWKKSRFDGAYLAWYPNGNKKIEGVYQKGEREGWWRNWGANGTLIFEAFYIYGEIDPTKPMIGDSKKQVF